MRPHTSRRLPAVAEIEPWELGTCEVVELNWQCYPTRGLALAAWLVDAAVTQNNLGDAVLTLGGREQEFGYEVSPSIVQLSG
jgi:hypothetical protein